LVAYREEQTLCQVLENLLDPHQYKLRLNMQISRRFPSQPKYRHARIESRHNHARTGQPFWPREFRRHCRGIEWGGVVSGSLRDMGDVVCLQPMPMTGADHSNA
jgi:hypothetical protein